MKRLLIGVTFAALVSGSAMAADMPVKARTAVPVYSWTGFYIGGNVGGAWGNFDPATSTVLNGAYFQPASVPQVNAAGAQSIKPNGFTGGIGAGYNWQTGNIVFGIDGDIQSLRLKGSAVTGPVTYVCCGGTFTVTSSASTSWLATARGRVGVAANNWLFYATGGAAFTTLNGNFSFADTFGAAESVSFSNTRTGYTVGGGVEAGLWGRWSAKAEYLYVNFGTVSATGVIGFAPTQPLFHSIDLKAKIARVGLNYRF